MKTERVYIPRELFKSAQFTLRMGTPGGKPENPNVALTLPGSDKSNGGSRSPELAPAEMRVAKV
jgi:hypothetical protein